MLLCSACKAGSRVDERGMGLESACLLEKGGKREAGKGREYSERGAISKLEAEGDRGTYQRYPCYGRGGRGRGRARRGGGVGQKAFNNPRPYNGGKERGRRKSEIPNGLFISLQTPVIPGTVLPFSLSAPLIT